MNACFTTPAIARAKALRCVLLLSLTAACTSASTPSASNAPGAPESVFAVAGNGSATITWKAPAKSGTDALSGYTVTADPGGTVQTTASGTLTARFPSLTNGTPYVFAVAAVSAAGTGPQAISNIVTPTAGITLPGAPVGVIAVAGDGQATVTWTAPASTGGGTLGSYVVLVSPGGATSTVAGTSTTITGLTDGTTYVFSVAATNEAGTGPSASSNAVTPESVPGAPGAPANVAVQAVGDGWATVTWTAPASNGGSAIQSFTVTPSGRPPVTVPGAATAETITGLTDGTSYTFSVLATNAAGSGPAATSAPATPVGLPGAPLGVIAVAGQQQATVTWSAPGTTGGGTLGSYVVITSPGGATTTIAGTSATITGLTAGTTYVFSVAATNQAGTGPFTASNAITVEASPGSPPTVTVSDQLSVGYQAPVTVTAQASGTPPLSYAWTRISGPAVTLTGANTATISFVTPDFITALGYGYPDGITGGGIELENARCGTRGIDRDQASNLVFQVTVTDGNGLTSTGTVRVASTRPSLGTRDVPIGVPVWLEGNGPDILLDGGIDQDSWSWTLVAAPNGSNAVLFAANGASQPYASGEDGQYAYFIPDVPGIYTLTEMVTNTGNTPCSFDVYAGLWQGMMTITGPTDVPPVEISEQLAAINCPQCHNNVTAPDKFTPWAKTAHATALQRKIEGSVGQAFNESCLECHTVGYDKTAQNNGFDDVAVEAGWTYPARNQPGNWSALESIQTPFDLADLAGIQCESCHGPQGGLSNVVHGTAATDSAARISWSTEVCSSCHESYTEDYAPSQWVEQGQYGSHSNRALAMSEASIEESPTADHCGRCHSAQGFGHYSANLPGGYYGYLTSNGNPLDPTYPAATAANAPATVGGVSAPILATWQMSRATIEPVTCTACHDPHDNTAGGTCPNGQLNGVDCGQLRVYDTIPALPNGQTNITGMGAGAICATCHNSRNGEHTDFNTQITQSVNTGTPTAPVWTATGIMVTGPLATFTTPHTPSQTDFYFGFNAYFGPRTTPSAHLAVANSCAGCHSQTPTASEALLQETSSHSFVVDNTICASCHTSDVNGAALEAANQAQLDNLRNLWASKLLTNLNAAIGTVGVKVTARAYQPSTGYYTSATKSQYIPIGPVTAITWANIGTAYGAPSYGGFGATTGLTLTLATPATNVTFYDTATPPNPHIVASISQLTVTLSSLTTNLAIPATPGYSAATYGPWTGAVDWTTTGPVAYLPPWTNGDIQTLIKAYWNLTLLSYDDTFGVHNPEFFNQVVANTSAQLELVQ